MSRGDSVFAAVADGVSSLPGSSEVAAAVSRAAVEALASQNSLEPDIEVLLLAVNQGARRAIRDTGEPGATTVVAGAFTSDGCWLMSIGDSEVLIVQATGPAQPLFEADHLPRRRHVLTRWIDGTTALTPHYRAMPGLPARICLVTDGVTEVLDYHEIARIVRALPSCDGAEVLVSAARDAAAADDTTAVVIGSE